MDIARNNDIPLQSRSVTGNFRRTVIFYGVGIIPGFGAIDDNGAFGFDCGIGRQSP